MSWTSGCFSGEAKFTQALSVCGTNVSSAAEMAASTNAAELAICERTIDGLAHRRQQNIAALLSANRLDGAKTRTSQIDLPSL